MPPSAIKALTKPALAILWSIAWIAIYIGTNKMPPDFVTTMVITSYSLFGVSREIEKKRDASKTIQSDLVEDRWQTLD